MTAMAMTRGDHLLVKLAARMKQTLREGDSLAGMGGDEFVAVLLDVEENSPLFARLLAAVAEPVEFEGFELMCLPAWVWPFTPRP